VIILHHAGLMLTTIVPNIWLNIIGQDCKMETKSVYFTINDCWIFCSFA